MIHHLRCVVLIIPSVVLLLPLTDRSLIKSILISCKVITVVGTRMAVQCSLYLLSFLEVHIFTSFNVFYNILIHLKPKAVSFNQVSSFINTKVTCIFEVWFNWLIIFLNKWWIWTSFGFSFQTIRPSTSLQCFLL